MLHEPAIMWVMLGCWLVAISVMVIAAPFSAPGCDNLVDTIDHYCPECGGTPLIPGTFGNRRNARFAEGRGPQYVFLATKSGHCPDCGILLDEAGLRQGAAIVLATQLLKSSQPYPGTAPKSTTFLVRTVMPRVTAIEAMGRIFIVPIRTRCARKSSNCLCRGLIKRQNLSQREIRQHAAQKNRVSTEHAAFAVVGSPSKM